MKFKFKNDKFGDRVLDAKDYDGDRLRIIRGADGSNSLVVNYEAVLLTTKQLRKFAKAILKEMTK